MQPRPVWTPLPGPQTEAWLSEADELFYGGSAGGGKSDLLIGLSITAHRRSRLFRREGTQLLGIIDRSREIIGTEGTYNGSSHIWRMADQRVIELAGVKEEVDKKRFQGRPADFFGFDEITEFLASQYRFLIGWNRTTVPGQRCRVLATGNPPTTAEGEWVIRYWAPWLDGQHPRPAEPGELRWFAVLDSVDVEVESNEPFVHKGETIYPRSRTFIPARLTDNPYLMDTGYAAVLQGMPEPLRSQMLYGDFEAGTKDDPWQVIPTAWIRAAQERWAAFVGPIPNQTAVGVDVARGGADKTVLAPRHRTWFGPPRKFKGTDTPDGTYVAGLVGVALADGGYANIDVIGVGSSAYDISRGLNLNVRPINFAAGSDGLDKSGRLGFVNVRAAAYWGMREALDPETGNGLMLPPDPELLADLTAPKWSMRTSGIQIESKEDLVKRLGRSPDVGDAVVLANYTGGALPFGWLTNQ